MSKGIDKLVRYREFQEGVVSMERAQRAQADRDAEAARETADARLEAMRAHRATLLQSPLLDLGRVQEVGLMELDARSYLAEREAEAEAARKDHVGAIAAHWSAKARVEVASVAAMRRRHEATEHAEKLAFDRMAELHQASKERGR